jgi:hypothetical protein
MTSDVVGLTFGKSFVFALSFGCVGFWELAGSYPRSSAWPGTAV